MDSLDDNFNISKEYERALNIQKSLNDQLDLFTDRMQLANKAIAKSGDLTDEQADMYKEMLTDMHKTNSAQERLNILKKTALAYIEQAVDGESTISDQLKRELQTQASILGTQVKMEAARDSARKIQEDIQAQYDEQFDTLNRIKNTALAVVSNPMTLMLYLGAKIAGKLKDIATHSFDVYKSTGGTVGETAQYAGSLAAANISLTGLLYGSDKLQASAEALTEQYGSMAAVNSESVKHITRLAALTGDASSAVKLNRVFLAMSDNSQAGAEHMIDLAKQSARASGVAPGAVMKSIAQSSGLFARSSKESALSLVKAAAEAKKLGLEMSNIQGIADTILDIESSLESELQAELALGRDLNLDRARMSAESNDMLGVVEELNKNFGSITEFQKLSRTQQKMVAQSIGVSADEMAELLVSQDTFVGGSKDTSTAWASIAGSVKGAGGALMSAAPMITALVGGGGVFGSLSKLGGKIGGFFGSMSSAPAATAGTSSAMGSLSTGIKSFGDPKVLLGAAALLPIAIGMTAMVPGIPSLMFFGMVPLKFLGDNLFGLAFGLESLGSPKAMLGGVTLMIAAPGMVMALAGIPFLALMAVPGFGKMIEMGLTGLGRGLSALGNPAVAVFGFIAAGLLIALSVAMIGFGYAVSLAGEGLESIGSAFEKSGGASNFIGGMMGLGLTGTMMVPAAIGFAAAGAGLVALAVGLAAVAPFIGIAQALGLASGGSTSTTTTSGGELSKDTQAIISKLHEVKTAIEENQLRIGDNEVNKISKIAGRMEGFGARSTHR